MARYGGRGLELRLRGERERRWRPGSTYHQQSRRRHIDVHLYIQIYIYTEVDTLISAHTHEDGQHLSSTKTPTAGSGRSDRITSAFDRPLLLGTQCTAAGTPLHARNAWMSAKLLLRVTTCTLPCAAASPCKASSTVCVEAAANTTPPRESGGWSLCGTPVLLL